MRRLLTILLLASATMGVSQAQTTPLPKHDGKRIKNIKVVVEQEQGQAIRAYVKSSKSSDVFFGEQGRSPEVEVRLLNGDEPGKVAVILLERIYLAERDDSNTVTTRVEVTVSQLLLDTNKPSEWTEVQPKQTRKVYEKWGCEINKYHVDPESSVQWLSGALQKKSWKKEGAGSVYETKAIRMLKTIGPLPLKETNKCVLVTETVNPSAGESRTTTKPVNR